MELNKLFEYVINQNTAPSWTLGPQKGQQPLLTPIQQMNKGMLEQQQFYNDQLKMMGQGTNDFNSDFSKAQNQGWLDHAKNIKKIQNLGNSSSAAKTPSNNQELEKSVKEIKKDTEEIKCNSQDEN